MELHSELRDDVSMYRAATFSDNTKKTYRCQIGSYFKFCDAIGATPVPATQELVSEYAAFLARRLKAVSVGKYLNVVRLLHIEAGYANPCDCWYVKSTLTGINRIKGLKVIRKTPVSPQLLLRLRQHLDLNTLHHAMFWAAALLMFFATFRKSNLFPVNGNEFSPDKQFVRSDFTACDDGTILINVKYSKTIQFKQRGYYVRLFSVDHPLCAVKALRWAFTLCRLGGDSPAFVQTLLGFPMDGKMFNSMFKGLVKRCGEDPKYYASHSFRRGSACWALQCGIPEVVVQQMGDWKSSCYKMYLDELPVSVHDKYRQRFAELLPTFPTNT